MSPRRTSLYGEYDHYAEMMIITYARTRKRPRSLTGYQYQCIAYRLHGSPESSGGHPRLPSDAYSGKRIGALFARMVRPQGAGYASGNQVPD
jgi:hypothetical protein